MIALWVDTDLKPIPALTVFYKTVSKFGAEITDGAYPTQTDVLADRLSAVITAGMAAYAASGGTIEELIAAIKERSESL